MSVAIVQWSLLAAQPMLGIGMLATVFRMIVGPRAQGRILALDASWPCCCWSRWASAPIRKSILSWPCWPACSASSARSPWPNS